MLLCDDRLMLYEGNFSDFDPLQSELLEWESVQVFLNV